MNKSEFLKKLAALLHILQEDEVSDILSEYEQHIDMKMEEGLSEQEAILDFGSVEELATEILSAYHVRTDFTKASRKENRMFGKVQDGSRKALNHAGEAAKTAGAKTGSFMKRIWNKIKELCKKPFVFMAGLNEKWKSSREEKTNEKERKGENKLSMKEKTKGIGAAFLDLCKSCIRFIIRMMFGCIFVCSGFVEAGLLLCTGVLLVIMLMGYPVIGITIAVIGMAMSVFVVTFYAAKKMRRRK